MKKPPLIVLFLLVVYAAFSQSTIPNSFICQLKPGYQGFTQKEITSFISSSHFENFRLLDKRTTLTFDNGFDIILLSAKELQQAGIMNDVTSYQSDFPTGFKLPVFHINDSGQIAAAYPVGNNFKYSSRKP